MAIECDVLVIGGGPAGLSAALILSNKGFSTVVIEKNETVGPEHTKYDITEGNRIREILQEMGIKPNKISSKSEWHSPNHSFVLDSEIEDFYFKRGSEEDSIENVLFRKLKRNNVEVFFKSKVKSIDMEGKKIVLVEIDTNSETIEPKHVIVADGPESEFRKRLNIKTKDLATFSGYGVLVESKEKDSLPHAKIYFDEKIAPGGYAYSGSVGNETFYCVVIDDKFRKESPKQLLNKFLEENVGEKFVVKNCFSGIGTSGIQEALVGNTLFIGGAALFYDPFLGYGLNYAIESAYFAAKAIEENNLEKYREYSNEIQKEIKDTFFAREIWRKADNVFFDKLIKTFNGQYEPKEEEIMRYEIHMF